MFSLPSEILAQTGAQKGDTILAMPQFALDLLSRTARRTEWIKAHGLSADMTAIRPIVKSALQPTTLPLSAKDKLAIDDAQAEYFAQNLAVLFGAREVKRLQAKGIDVVKAMVLHNAASLPQIAQLAELIVVGKIVSSDPRVALGDGFYSTTTFEVEEVIKGHVTDPHILLRERSGVAVPGRMTKASADVLARPDRDGTDANPGMRFVLIISSRLYPLRAYENTGINATHPETYYLSQWVPWELDGQRIVPPPVSTSAESLPKTLQEVRDATKVSSPPVDSISKR